MRRWLLAIPGLLMVALMLLVAAPERDGRGPVDYEQERRDDPPMRLHVVTVDLTDPRVSVTARPAGEDPDGEGRWQTTLMTTSEIARRDGLDVAVNGDFFSVRDSREIAGRELRYFEGNRAAPRGFAMTDGRLWSESSRGASPSLIVDGEGEVRIGQFDRLPPGTSQAISGSGVIVHQRRNMARGDARAPRTAVGLDFNRRTLVLLVVDGRREGHSAGMTLPELADEMIRLGCHTALNLDGGGSSTLVMRDEATDERRVMNRPSDGSDLVIPLSVERPVANVLGIRIEGE